MKKILKYLTMFLAVIAINIVLTSCEDPKPACEEDQTGSVKVINHSGYPISVDVTWGSSSYNDERRISNNYSTTYSNVPAGTVKVWASYDGNNWTSGYLSVSSCNTSTYTWNYKKSPPNEISFDVENGIEIQIINPIQKDRK